VIVNHKEPRQSQVLVEVVEGRMTVGQIVISMNLSVRQTQRILAAFRKEGAAGVAHGNRELTIMHPIEGQNHARLHKLASTT
jgi:hypothetical protein